MKSITVKELMVPLEAYATVSKEVTLREAVLALEKAQLALGPSQHKHRAILVLERSGFSPDLIKDMLKDQALWAEPLQFFCERPTRLKVIDFIQAPSEGEYIEEILEQATQVLQSTAVK